MRRILALTFVVLAFTGIGLSAQAGGHLSSEKTIVTNAAQADNLTTLVAAVKAAGLVDALNADGVRTHARKRDYYSATVLEPLGIENCVRASVSHYNSRSEVEQLLATVNRLAGS